MQLTIDYGNKILPISMPEKIRVSELEPVALPVIKSLQRILKDELENPRGSDPFAKILGRKQPKSIAIAVPNLTSQMPVKDILPVLLENIFTTLPSLTTSSVKIIIAQGFQSGSQIDSYNKIFASAIAQGCELLVHDPVISPMKEVGITREGTPMRINKYFAEAEFKVCIGQIEPHQIIGFTGASEEVTIGCQAKEGIGHALRLMSDSKSIVGRMDENPVRKDLNEADRMIGMDFSISVVLDMNNKVVQVLAGQSENVLMAGAKTCANVYGVSIEHKFDIVIVCCSEHSKIKFNYKLEQGLKLVAHIIEKGGNALLLTASQQGLGKDIYFDYVCQNVDPDKILAKFNKLKHQMEPNNAYFMGKINSIHNADHHCNLNLNKFTSCHLRAADISMIVREWINDYKGQPKLAIIPNTNIYIKE